MKHSKTLSNLVLATSLVLTPACNNKDRCEDVREIEITKCDSGSDKIRKYCKKLRAESRAKLYAACRTNRRGIPNLCEPETEGSDIIHCTEVFNQE